MPYGPFGNLFPYSDQHSLNLDWIIQVAKDFLDQYTNIQETITNGENSLDQHTTDGLAALAAEKDRLEGLLDAWYTTHSEDIADQLTAAVASFQASAEAIGAQVIASIPQDYTALEKTVDDLIINSNHAPYGILPYNLSLFKPTANLYSDFCYKITNGYYTAAKNPAGHLSITNANNWTGWLIRVKPSTTYTTGPLDFRIRFVDNGLLYCGEVDSPSAEETNSFTTPATAAWMCLTQRSARDMSSWMMVEGDTYPANYVSGYPEWIDLPRMPGGTNTTFALFFSSSPIEVIYGETNSLVIPNGRLLLRTGASETITGTTLTFTTSKWISYDMTAGSWVMDDTDAGKELYTIGWVSTVANDAFFAGHYEITIEEPAKVIAFMGDSITAGVGVASSKAYHMYLHDRYGWTCLNYGYGGSGYYKSYTGTSSGRLGLGEPGIGPAIDSENAFTPNNVAARLTELNPNNIDGIVIFAGTNDWGNNVSVDDFKSGIESAFEYCKTNLTDVPVLVMTPIHRKGDTIVNSQGKTLSEYVDIILEECRKYSMAVVDCMTMTGIYPDNAANLAEFFATDSSGLHPSTEGHKRIASVVGETLKQVIDCHNF